jgi:iron complex outermembrane receptor protein
LEWIAGAYFFDQSSMAEYTYELSAIQGVFEGAFGLPPGGLGDPSLNPFYEGRVNGDTPSAVPFTDFNTEQDTESLAAFAQGTWHFTDRLRGTLGARITDEKKDIVQTWRTNISPRGCEDLRQDEDWNEVTWKVGLDYDQSDDVLVYGSVSRGFKAGGFNGGSCGNVYDPESLLAYEVGIKSVFADRRVQLNLAGFYYDYDDYQARLFIGGSALIENAAKAELMGAEAEFVLRPLERLGVDGNVSWLGGEFTEAQSENPMTPGAGAVDLEGNDMLRAPKVSYNLGVEYEFPLGRNSWLVPRYEVSYKDDYYNSIFNDDFMRVDSHAVQNFRVTWSNGNNLQVQAFVENLTDEEYLEALISSPSVGGTLGMWSLPRTWGIKLSFDSF